MAMDTLLHPPSMCCHRDNPPNITHQIQCGLIDLMQEVETIHNGTNLVGVYLAQYGDGPSVSFGLHAIDQKADEMVGAIDNMLKLLRGEAQ